MVPQDSKSDLPLAFVDPDDIALSYEVTPTLLIVWVIFYKISQARFRAPPRLEKDFKRHGNFFTAQNKSVCALSRRLSSLNKLQRAS